MSLRSISAMHRFCAIATTVFLLTACADSTAPTATPLALSDAVTQTAPAAQANQPLPVTATSTPEPTPTSASAPTATATPHPPKPTATFTPAPTEPPVVVTATPPEVVHGVEFAIERKTVEAPDGSNLEVVGWNTGKLGIYFEKAFAEEAYTFGLDVNGPKKEAGAILMPDPNVSWEEIQSRFENLVTVVVGAKLGLVDTSKPIPQTKLEEIKKYLAAHPDASYEVRSGGKVVGRVKANAPITIVFARPKLNAERTMKWDFPKDEEAVMAPFTVDRSLILDNGRGEHNIDREGNLEIVFEPWWVGEDGVLMSTDEYWQLGLVTVFGCEAGGAFDIAKFRGQAFDVDGYEGFRGIVPLGSGFWRPTGELYREDGRPPKDPVVDWGQP